MTRDDGEGRTIDDHSSDPDAGKSQEKNQIGSRAIHPANTHSLVPSG